ncbi:hypothetical protein GNF85_18715 [Clostridium perfringens]
MSIRDDDKSVIADFYKYAFVGLMLDWIAKGMKEEPAAIVDRLSILIQGDIFFALEKFKSHHDH